MSAANEINDTGVAVRSAPQRHTPLEGDRRPGLRETDSLSEHVIWGEVYPLED